MFLGVRQSTCQGPNCCIFVRHGDSVGERWDERDGVRMVVVAVVVVVLAVANIVVNWFWACPPWWRDLPLFRLWACSARGEWISCQ